MQLNTHEVVRHERGFCLIVPDLMTALDVSEDTTLLIDQAGHCRKEDLSDESLGILRELKLLDYELPPEETQADNAIDIMKIALFVTQDCNFNCVYCYGAEEGGSIGGTYGSRGKMVPKTAAKAIDWLLDASGDSPKVGIGFFGGEPFLNFPVIKQVVDYANARAKEFNKTVDFNITTNGSLLNDERIQFLKENNIYTTVSMDGGKRIQDKQRPLPNGKGTYEITAPKVKKLLKILPETVCRGTIFDDKDVEEAEAGLREMGFKSTYLTVASPSLFSNSDNRDSEEPRFGVAREKARKEAKQLGEAIKLRDTGALEELKKSGTWASKITRFTQEFIYHQKRKFPCGAGRNYAGVSASGDIYPCHRLVGAKDQKIGSVFGGDVERSTFHRTTLGAEDGLNHCSDCFAKYVCAGGCHHDNLGATGHVHGPDQEMCGLIRAVVQEAAVLCSQMTADERRFLVEEKIIQPPYCPQDMFDT